MKKYYKQIRNIIAAISIIENRTIYESCVVSLIIMETGFKPERINRCEIELEMSEDGRMTILSVGIRTQLSTILSSRIIRYYNVYQNLSFLEKDIDELIEKLKPLIKGVTSKRLQEYWIRLAFKMGLNTSEISESTDLSSSEISQFVSTKSALLVRGAISHHMANLY